MPPHIRVKEKEKDDNLGISKKEIIFPNGLSIVTPTKSYIGPQVSSKYYPDDKLSEVIINEISRRMDFKTIETLDLKYRNMLNKLKKRYIKNRVNLFIPHLRIPQILDSNHLNIFAQFIYSASESCIVLPTVDSSFFKEYVDLNKERMILDQERINDYIIMIKKIIQEINAVGNNKPYIGMIPLMPVRFIKELLFLYQDLGINSFIIDAGTKDTLGASEVEFRVLLREIHSNVSRLPESLILASNLGYGLFATNQTIADDFLSLFAYVDIFNGTFKARGFRKKGVGKKYIPKAKTFSKDDYVYFMSTYKQAENDLNIPKLNRQKLREYNEREQLSETNSLTNMIGDIDMIRYLLQKDTLLRDEIKIRRLRNIVDEVKA